MTTQTKTTLLGCRREAKAGWRKVKLGDALQLLIDHRGKTPKKLGGDWSREGIPALSAKNIKGGRIINESDIRYVNQKLYDKWMREKLEAGDILLTSEAPLGELLYLKEKADYCLSQRLFALRTQSQKLYSRFLYYYLLSPIGQHQLLRRISGTAAEGIRQAELRQLEVNYPESIKDQKRIADILSAFDDKIELNNKISRTLEEMAQAIFKEWFVKNSKFKNQNAKLEEIAKIIKGKKPQRIFNKSHSGYTEYLLIESFITNNRFFTDDDKVPQSEDGDTIIVMDGASSGRIFRGRKGAVGSTLAVIKPKQGISCEFLFLLLKHAEPQLMDNLTGSAIPHLDKYFLKTYLTSVPTLEIMEKFTYTVKSMLQKMVEIENENQKLATLRDLLLPKLMGGEIRV
jgi:type I restriction enzyme S subunit